MKKLISVIIAIALVTGFVILITRQEKTLVIDSMPMDYENIIKDAAEKYDIPPSLLFALIYTESRFDKDAESPVGAVGLTQINEQTFDWIKWRMDDERDISFEDVRKPEISVDYGAFLLKHHLDEFGSVDCALCAYNAGRGNLMKWLGDDEYSKDTKDGRQLTKIPFKETEAYVQKVNDVRVKYQEIYKLK